MQPHQLYLRPTNRMCGTSNCIFWDHSHTIRVKKETQLMPYVTNCSVEHIKCDSNLLKVVPSGCVEQNNSVLLFGLSSCITGDTMYNVGTLRTRYLSMPDDATCSRLADWNRNWATCAAPSMHPATWNRLRGHSAPPAKLNGTGVAYFLDTCAGREPAPDSRRPYVPQPSATGDHQFTTALVQEVQDVL